MSVPSLRKGPAWWVDDRAYSTEGQAMKAALAKLADQRVRRTSDGKITPEEIAEFIYSNHSAINDILSGAGQ